MKLRRVVYPSLSTAQGPPMFHWSMAALGSVAALPYDFLQFETLHFVTFWPSTTCPLSEHLKRLFRYRFSPVSCAGP